MKVLRNANLLKRIGISRNINYFIFRNPEHKDGFLFYDRVLDKISVLKDEKILRRKDTIKIKMVEEGQYNFPTFVGDEYLFLVQKSYYHKKPVITMNDVFIEYSEIEGSFEFNARVEQVDEIYYIKGELVTLFNDKIYYSLNILEDVFNDKFYKENNVSLAVMIHSLSNSSLSIRDINNIQKMKVIRDNKSIDYWLNINVDKHAQTNNTNLSKVLVAAFYYSNVSTPNIELFKKMHKADDSEIELNLYLSYYGDDRSGISLSNGSEIKKLYDRFIVGFDILRFLKEKNYKELSYFDILLNASNINFKYTTLYYLYDYFFNNDDLDKVISDIKLYIKHLYHATKENQYIFNNIDTAVKNNFKYKNVLIDSYNSRDEYFDELNLKGSKISDADRMLAKNLVDIDPILAFNILYRSKINSLFLFNFELILESKMQEIFSGKDIGKPISDIPKSVFAENTIYFDLVETINGLKYNINEYINDGLTNYTLDELKNKLYQDLSYEELMLLFFMINFLVDLEGGKLKNFAKGKDDLFNLCNLYMDFNLNIRFYDLVKIIYFIKLNPISKIKDSSFLIKSLFSYVAVDDIEFELSQLTSYILGSRYLGEELTFDLNDIFNISRLYCGDILSYNNYIYDQKPRRLFKWLIKTGRLDNSYKLYIPKNEEDLMSLLIRSRTRLDEYVAANMDQNVGPSIVFAKNENNTVVYIVGKTGLTKKKII